MNNKRFAVAVEEVHSGDDMVVMVDLGIDKLFKRQRIRLAGVDTPNAYKAKGESEAGVIREEVRQLIDGCKCSIEVLQEGKGGWLVNLYIRNKEQNEMSVNEFLKGRGFIYRGKSDGAGISQDSQSQARA